MTPVNRNLSAKGDQVEVILLSRGSKPTAEAVANMQTSHEQSKNRSCVCHFMQFYGLAAVR